jgi:phage/conjugal plasmid C-4 type zinc finger TraR family protein
MPDDVDRLTDQQQLLLDKAIQAQRPTGEGALTCDDCDEEIPERRRQAYPAARCCVRCQQAREMKR